MGRVLSTSRLFVALLIAFLSITSVFEARRITFKNSDGWSNVDDEKLLHGIIHGIIGSPFGFPGWFGPLSWLGGLPLGWLSGLPLGWLGGLPFGRGGFGRGGFGRGGFGRGGFPGGRGGFPGGRGGFQGDFDGFQGGFDGFGGGLVEGYEGEAEVKNKGRNASP